MESLGNHDSIVHPLPMIEIRELLNGDHDHDTIEKSSRMGGHVKVQDIFGVHTPLIGLGIVRAVRLTHVPCSPPIGDRRAQKWTFVLLLKCSLEASPGKQRSVSEDPRFTGAEV